MGERLGIHPAPRVADRDDDVPSGRNRIVRGRERRVESHIGQLDRQAAASGHGVAGIDGEIQENLLDLPGVRLHAAERRGLHDDDLDVLADQAPQHLLRVGDDRAEIEDARLQDLPPAESEELPRQGRGPFGRPDDLAHALAALRIVGERRPEQLGVTLDDRQEIVEVVGDSAREAAHRLHLLRLAELRLELKPLGDVPTRRVHEAPAADRDEPVVELDGHLAAVLLPDRRLRQDLLASQDALMKGAIRREIGLLVEVGNPHRQQLLAGVARQLRRGAG